MLEALLARFHESDRMALARLLTLVVRGEHLEAIRAALPREREHAGRTRVVAVTGSGGVGKSSLIGTLIELLRSRQQTVAVLACDPESSLTGGALLADRIRMPSRPDDPGVYIRSMTAPNGRQGIAEHLHLMIDLLRAFGFDVVLLETAGVGQGDTAVWDLSDVVVLLLQPETGDEFQWEKAGLLEVADVVVVHKADLPGAEATEAQVRGLLNLPGCREVPVLRAAAARDGGSRNCGVPSRQSRPERSKRLPTAGPYLGSPRNGWRVAFSTSRMRWRRSWNAGGVASSTTAPRRMSFSGS